MSIIEKLISYSITEAQNNRVEEQIPLKCWDFMKKMMDSYVKLEFMPIDRDDFSMNKEARLLLSKESNKALGLGQFVNTIPKDREGSSNTKFMMEFNKPSSSLRFSDLNFKGFTEGSNNLQSLDSINESATEAQNLNFIEKDGDKITPMYKKGQEINYNQKFSPQEKNYSNENENEQNISNLGDENLAETVGIKNNFTSSDQALHNNINNIQNYFSKDSININFIPNQIFYDNKIIGTNVWSLIEQPVILF
jgi:hypothetical protein